LSSKEFPDSEGRWKTKRAVDDVKQPVAKPELSNWLDQ
jgi:cell pole-organizing protein PopZ